MRSIPFFSAGLDPIFLCCKQDYILGSGYSETINSLHTCTVLYIPYLRSLVNRCVSHGRKVLLVWVEAGALTSAITENNTTIDKNESFIL